MKQNLKRSFVGGNSLEKTPLEEICFTKFCRGKTHKRYFRVTHAFGETKQMHRGISLLTMKLRNDLLGNNFASTFGVKTSLP